MKKLKERASHGKHTKDRTDAKSVAPEDDEFSKLEPKQRWQLALYKLLPQSVQAFLVDQWGPTTKHCHSIYSKESKERPLHWTMNRNPK